MAFFDQTLLLSNAQAITTTADSTNVYDVTGAGVGVAPNLVFGQGITNFGADIGTGDGAAVPYAYFTVNTTGTGAGTITFTVSAAPANVNAAGTYKVLASSAAYVGTTLIAGDVIAFPIPPYELIGPAEGMPRFYKFTYTVSGSATVTVTAGILLNPPLGYIATQIPSNFIAV